MASSRTEVCWAEPGLGKGPRRRRWAWAEEKKDADGIRGKEGPFPSATSPELLEDFRLGQPHLQPPGWGPAPQPAERPASECGESAGEEFEVEDVDSPESSNLPLNWLPEQDPQSAMTEEEPDEALGGPEVEEAEEGSPRLEYETGLSSGGDGNTSPMAVGWGQDTGWVAPGTQVSGDKLPEHSEVHPTVDFSSARSWSSGTVSLDHPNDSLDSTWEGETDVPQPTALEETLPQSSSHHLLNPNPRTGGGVAVATPTEFQDSSVPQSQSLQCPADKWKETTGLSCPQLRDKAWKRTRTSPKPLPSRFTGSISPPNLPRPARQDRVPTRQGATLAGHSSSDASKYGRGQLNYPLPDFSKVRPRVRFPKDESYHPPKARSHSRQSQGPARPLIFKSPAEIVREVLLSSGEACPEKDPPSPHPITRVPQEFQTPEQATKLVHQLQEDYHKLLTKYAEAENTIDQLRLGAKVNLYSDPPQPSHSIHTGTVPQGTKVLSFTIPQPQSVERWSGPAEAPQASGASGWPPAQRDLSPSSSAPEWLPENPGIAQDQLSAERTQELASQASLFLAKVESFAGLMQAGRLTPQDQLKGFQRLKAAHAALEEEYLKACREQQLAQQLAGPQGTPSKFDPGRVLEEEIFQLGIRLEELKDHMDHTQPEPERAGSDSTPDSPPATPSPRQPVHLPSPSGQAPTPATQTLCPQPHATSIGPCPSHVNVELSTASSETEDGPLGLPAPPRNKELPAEQDFHGLLERYLSVKTVPEARKPEEGEDEDEDEDGRGHSVEVDGPAPPPRKSEATGMPIRQLPAPAERSHRTPLKETVEQMVSVKPAGFHASVARDGYLQDLDKVEAAPPPGPSRPPHPRGTKPLASHQSSLTSLEGSGLSEHLPQKSLHQAGGPHLEEPWMASPETDSGFVGSETSRVSPLTQTPEHRFSHISTAGTLAQPFTASEPRDAVSHPQTRGPPVPRRSLEPSTPRSRAQRRPSGRDSPLQQRAPSFRQERALVAEMAVPGSESEGRQPISEQLARSTTIRPPPTSASAAATLSHGPAESTRTLLLTRTGRDQAIRELQEEVSLLRLRLEDSLHQPPQGSLVCPASTFNRPARARARPTDSSAAWGSHYGSKSTERLSGEPAGAEQADPAGRRRARSSSVPREVPQLSLSSGSEPTSPQLFSEKSRTSENSAQAARDGMKRAGGTKRPDRVTFRGQYTGQEYHVPTPKTVPRGGGTISCPHCRPARTQDSGGTVTRDPLGPVPTDTLRCPLCGQVGTPPKTDGPDSATSGTESATPRRNAHSRSASSPPRRSKQAGSPARPPPGLWYLPAVPPAPAPPAFAYVSSVPIVPYPSAAVYYAPPGPTSASSPQPAATEWPPSASSRPARGHRHSIQLDLEDLEELNKALNRAVQAAESIRCTTKHMSRSLSADLRQARSLRGSCLF
ncbi:microtubule organization protein AKNA isoform X1 [Prionailurus viverrinus]|uniref:microtubule organization protein AKNA isoform X1 n=1 Tax=Prionailurus viverrinus TaxID=61388 RepID=UPI001FF4BD2C|nr:microtubule organization protein AKNA isoform X1 [Prionailurus viverrinus]XP_047684945.1 microtubule organization protein AKNA isoform X1 [Prionailurus viverrinus]XP_047684946.1 microtubule organization protein AKNA isoform X1 [Prionailurus viverrinus]XP_047684947.1 microtubule organization protein AKNA isoform X1 [Prionailurus viverrinus]XP_047684948.1 microtubule organization protein AKNA isoform X1 [Prionailurus viverrinus]